MVSGKDSAAAPLDDIMIAMDVVDTLRHDKRIVERELNNEKRRAELIERLRKLYQGQGIDVPDSILEDGVKALEEQRFVYDPPDNTLAVRLAKLYVTRHRWGRWVLGAIAAVIAVALSWYLFYERPRVAEQRQVQVELSQELPAQVDTLMRQIADEAKSDALIDEARGIANSAKSAAAGGQLTPARDGVQQLSAMLDEIRREFIVRIVNREGEVTGLWRVPRVNPNQRNYYLVVEALDPSGRVIERDITNEETGDRDRVTKWAVRVPKSVFDAVQADKLDDGIIQNSVVGRKQRGLRDLSWDIDVLSGGALTKW